MNKCNIREQVMATVGAIAAALCSGCPCGDVVASGDEGSTSMTTGDGYSTNAISQSSTSTGDESSTSTAGPSSGERGEDSDTGAGSDEDGGGTESEVCPGDLDCDGLGDNEDPLPTDPFPPFIVNGTENGVIHLRLSNGDGTFSAPVEIGIPYGGVDPGPDDYSIYYGTLAVSNFDSDGPVDIIALSRREAGGPVQMWAFDRNGPTSFSQHLIDSDVPSDLGLRPVDLNGDFQADVYGYTYVKDPFLTDVHFRGFLGQGEVDNATCAVSDDPLNPEGCVFVRAPETDLTPWFSGEWGFGAAFYGRDLNGDGLGDLLITKYATGGASPSPLGFIAGNGDGTFSSDPMLLHTHTLPVNTIVLEDFNNDGVLDTLAGCDDDGDPGSLWLYPGQLAEPVYSLDGSGGFEAIDFGDSGARCAVASLDYDGDGNVDLVIGRNTGAAYSPPTELSYVRGLGDGSFEAPVAIDGYEGGDAQRVTGPVLYQQWARR